MRIKFDWVNADSTPPGNIWHGKDNIGKATYLLYTHIHTYTHIHIIYHWIANVLLSDPSGADLTLGFFIFISITSEKLIYNFLLQFCFPWTFPQLSEFLLLPSFSFPPFIELHFGLPHCRGGRRWQQESDGEIVTARGWRWDGEIGMVRLWRRDGETLRL